MRQLTAMRAGLRRRRAAGPLAVALILACVAPASAEVIERERFIEPISEDYEFCGLAVHEEGSVAVAVHFRVGTGEREQAFFQHLTYKFATTITNTANGRFVTVVAHEVIQDVKATHLEGTLFQETYIEAGKDWVIRNMNGDLILHDRGVARVSFIFDTLGDGMPGGEIVEILSDDARGPHPSWNEEEFCATIRDTIG
jgi:hypothetical protein